MRSYRSREGRSQKWLAERIGVTRTTISNWEQGNYLPRNIDDVEKITWILNLLPEESDRLLNAADPSGRHNKRGDTRDDSLIIRLDGGELRIAAEDRFAVILLLKNLPLRKDSEKPTKSQIKNIAREFQLLERRGINKHLRYKDGDISYWHEQDLCADELFLEFASRKVILDAAERAGVIILDQGKLSMLSTRLIPWLEQSTALK